MISIITPVFNDSKTIGRAVRSILDQTYKDYEIIVVDDGSTDDTKIEIEKFGEDVKYIYQENSGPAAARNLALKHAKGEWISFLDADDQWLPEKLEKQMELLNSNPELRWCCTNRYQSDGERKAVFGDENKIKDELGDKDYFENYFAAATKGACPIITSCLTIRKDIFDELGGFNEEYLRGQDQDMWWRIAHYYPAIGFIPEPLVVRYLGEENPVTQKRRRAEWKGTIRRQLVEEHYKLAKQNNSLDVFRPFASMMLCESLLAMVFGGYKAQARQTIKQFPSLVPFHWKAAVYVSTVFPGVTSYLGSKAVKLACLLGIDKKVTRRHIDTS